MKLNITTSPSLSIARSEKQMPPLGAFLPALQDATISINMDICNLSSLVDASLPPGFQVFVGSDIIGWNGSSWEDGNTGLPVTGYFHTGSATFRNPASYDIGITW